MFNTYDRSNFTTLPFNPKKNKNTYRNLPASQGDHVVASPLSSDTYSSSWGKGAFDKAYNVLFPGVGNISGGRYRGFGTPNAYPYDRNQKLMDQTRRSVVYTGPKGQKKPKNLLSEYLSQSNPFFKETLSPGGKLKVGKEKKKNQTSTTTSTFDSSNTDYINQTLGDQTTPNIPSSLANALAGLRVIDPRSYARAITDLQYNPVINEVYRQQKYQDAQAKQEQSDIKSWYEGVIAAQSRAASADLETQNRVMHDLQATQSGLNNAFGDDPTVSSLTSGYGSALQGTASLLAANRNQFDQDRMTNFEATKAQQLTNNTNRNDTVAAELRAQMVDLFRQKGGAYTKNYGDAQQLALQQASAIQNMSIAQTMLPYQLQSAQLGILGQQQGLQFAAQDQDIQNNLYPYQIQQYENQNALAGLQYQGQQIDNSIAGLNYQALLRDYMTGGAGLPDLNFGGTVQSVGDLINLRNQVAGLVPNDGKTDPKRVFSIMRNFITTTFGSQYGPGNNTKVASWLAGILTPYIDTWNQTKQGKKKPLRVSDFPELFKSGLQNTNASLSPFYPGF